MSSFKEDMVVKTAWGFTLTQWDRLSPQQQAYCRERVTQAPNFGAVR
jgi:hypothetical protein